MERCAEHSKHEHQISENKKDIDNVGSKVGAMEAEHASLKTIVAVIKVKVDALLWIVGLGGATMIAGMIKLIFFNEAPSQ